MSSPRGEVFPLAKRRTDPVRLGWIRGFGIFRGVCGKKAFSRDIASVARSMLWGGSTSTTNASAGRPRRFTYTTSLRDRKGTIR